MSQDSTLRKDPSIKMPPGDPQLMSRRILSHLLSELKSKLDQPRFKRYSRILNESQHLEEVMYRCVRFDILALIDDGILLSNRDTRLDARTNFDTGYKARAIYLHVVEDHVKQGRFYVGQSKKFKERIVDHMNFEHREHKMALHYYSLRQSARDYYVVLSYVPDAATCEGLSIRGDRGKHSPLLDLLETWCCLMFQTLPDKHLREFLPHDISLRVIKGLNIQLPLRSSDDVVSNWAETKIIRAESPDPVHQAYYSWQSPKFHRDKPELQEHHKAGLEICKRLDGISSQTSTPLRSNLLSPPSTKPKAALGRPRSESSKQLWPGMPSITNSSMVSGDESRFSLPTNKRGSHMDRNEYGKRKRDDDSISKCEDLTRLPVERKLFKSAAKPKEDLDQMY